MSNFQGQQWPTESKENYHDPQLWWSVFGQKFDTGT